MQLEQILRKRQEEKEILLMTHIVLGYPSFEANREVIRQMVENGVDCIEMQIPFSEPMADGPVILKANQDSLASGTTVAQCFEFAAEMTKLYDIPFLFMTYYNIIFKYGEEHFFSRCKEIDIQGLIIPDLPVEMGAEFFAQADNTGVTPVMLYAPTTTPERMSKLAENAKGFIYCVARRGVTGKKSAFDHDFNEYLARCRASSSVPIAVGFGIRNREDILALTGRADMAVIGSETIRLVDAEGPEAVGPFIAALRE